MEFIHRPYQPGETIAGISTPPGEGGISIIRISGKEAIAVADKLFSGPVETYATHTAHLGIIRDATGQRIDEALLLLMRAPRSFTGEDTVELQCHGGMIASKKVLEAALAVGARAALPGEFTFKAYMNGKLDLTQAEAVQKLISAKNEQAYTAAGHHLEGGLSKKIRGFQQELIRLGAILEAWVDFPEEGIEFASEEHICNELTAVSRQIKELIETFDDGRRLENGISLCIVGSPNAGKSSLMNALLDQDRAIVSSTPGTTRDLLHEEFLLGGLHFKLTDTAGIREASGHIEQEGIRRSKAALEQADLVLLVVDASKKIGKKEKILFELLPQDKTIAVWNKIDLPCQSLCQTPFPRRVSISAKTGFGLADLKRAIEEMVWQKGAPPKDEIVITTQRHKEALCQARGFLDKVVTGLLKGVSPEFLTADLRSALSELGKMMGTNVSEEILSSIFSQFCIGK